MRYGFDVACSHIRIVNRAVASCDMQRVLRRSTPDPKPQIHTALLLAGDPVVPRRADGLDNFRVQSLPLRGEVLRVGCPHGEGPH